MMDYMKKFSLEGKTAVVCGGLGLIGKEISTALAQAGAKTIVLDIDEEKGKQLEQDCKNIIFKKFDITKLNEYKNEIEKLYNEYGAIDIFVNTAYPKTKDWGDKIENIKTESWQKNVDIQMNSYCLMAKEIAELMKKNKIKGSIINIGSTYGVVSPDFEVYEGTDMTCPAAYAAIKGGIINFTRYCASYYGKNGIRINCLCPGGVFDNQNETFVKNYEKRTPLKRMGSPEEIASVVVFLASNAASYITGAIIMVDGGWTCI